MSKIYLLRHGQASLGSDDYDQLSPIGRKQAILLGDYWGKRGKTVQHLFVGPLRRHQQTFLGFSEGYEAHGLRLPTPVINADFIEHNGIKFAQAMLPLLIETDSYIAKHHHAEMPQPLDLRLFRHILERWANGEISHPDFQTWEQFSAGVHRGMNTVMNTLERSQTAIVFTSGGTMGAAIGRALELSRVRSIKMSWVIRNTASAEFQFRNNDLTLTEFNAIPHIEGRELRTYV